MPLPKTVTAPETGIIMAIVMERRAKILESKSHYYELYRELKEHFDLRVALETIRAVEEYKQSLTHGN